MGLGRLVIQVLVHQAVMYQRLFRLPGIVNVKAADDVSSCNIGYSLCLWLRWCLDFPVEIGQLQDLFTGIGKMHILVTD